MPEVNGIEFLERLYSRKTDPPVLMISSVNRTDIELATKSLSLGAFDYVEKPAMNNLKKSTEEILTKAKMALRAKDINTQQATGSFDASIGQKIVVPDASRCLRVVVATNDSHVHLEQVVRGQKNEYRSPALLIVMQNSASELNIESEILKWTERQVVQVRDENPHYKPNCVYIVKADFHQQILSKIDAKSISLQILSQSQVDLSGFKKFASLQILISEHLAEYSKAFERNNGLKISDVTPATSFPSLSAEYFANLRKAAA